MAVTKIQAGPVKPNTEKPPNPSFAQMMFAGSTTKGPEDHQAS